MKYIVDFDHTLLDTDAFVQAVDTAKKRDILITPEIWKFFSVRDFLYSDTLSWLAEKEKDAVHILTAFTLAYGPQAEAFQKEKLKSGNFDDLVASITYVPGEKGQAAKEIAQTFAASEPIVFIDDRIEHCLSVQAALPHAYCFLIVRNPAVIGDVKNIQTIAVVHTLAEVDDRMKKL